MTEKKNDETAVQIAKITSRSQILTAVIGVSSGIVIALLSSDLLATPEAAGCDVIEVAGRYGEGDAWEVEMDLATGQFESEEQSGAGRVDGTVTALCTSDRFSARVEGRRADGGGPVLCLFHGARTGAEGRSVAGRFMCDDMTPAERGGGYWQGDLRLMSDV